MNKIFNARTITLLAVCVFLFPLVFCACSGTADLETQVSGKWQRPQDGGIVDINLSSDPKMLIVDGNSYNAEIQEVDAGAYTVKVKVQTPAGDSEVWSITQKWNDNGSSFNLAFRHNGTTETLLPADKS